MKPRSLEDALHLSFGGEEKWYNKLWLWIMPYEYKIDRAYERALKKKIFDFTDDLAKSVEKYGISMDMLETTSEGRVLH